MFRYFILFSAVLLSLDSWCQGSKYSPLTVRLLRETENYRNSPTKTDTSLPDALVKKYHLRYEDGRYLVSGLLKVEAGTDNSRLEAAGAQIRTSTRTVRSFSAPLEALPALANVPGVKYIQIDEGARTKLKEAVIETNTRRVHAGQGGLPRAYDGTGVLVGVVDVGFDPNHPMFRSADGSRRRVVAYKYGNLNLENPEQIANVEPDQLGGTHGTHVGSIAAGSNWKAPVPGLTGYAPGAELVFFSLAQADSSLGLESIIFDAVSYIFDYANRQGKPVVVNMSLGTHKGPHDGTSILDQGFDELIEGSRGRVLVGSAGNEGINPIYLEHTFGQRDTIKTIIQFEGSEDPFKGFGQIDIWGTAGKEFKVGTQVIDSLTGQTLFVSPQFASSKVESEFEHFFEVNEDRGAGALGVVNPSFVGNNKPNIRLNVGNNMPAYLVLWLTGEPGSTVRLWNDGVGGGGGGFVDTLDGGIKLNGARSGSNASTIGEIGGTGRSVITVGAYTTLNRYRALNGEEITIAYPVEIGDIAPFSSQGPTADGRIKPDITAPGNAIVAAGASFSLFAQDDELIVHTVDENGTTYPYLCYEGTSMAAPGIAGVVALMLEANPNLTFNQVKAILQNTARTDNFTGRLPVTGNNIWGRGKVDALAAVLGAITTVSVPDRAGAAPTYAFHCFPNPASDRLKIETTLPSRYTASLYEPAGRRLWTQTSTGSLSVDTTDLQPGLYMLQLEGEGIRQYVKVLIAR